MTRKKKCDVNMGGVYSCSQSIPALGGGRG